ncbi:MAG TPA: putative toxin-antitoxin system toxin component, PIN family [Acidobacteriaceae bacterium]|nr:putative toxin-antitoxin system toxin component, PIN family [Acidobacteriaceae bacterium]
MRLTLDTTVLVAAFRSHTGASRRLFDYVPQRRFRLVASSALYLEYEAVLTRPEQIAVHGVTPQKIELFLIDLASLTDRVRISFNYRPQLRDADDEMVLEAAINGRADAIVTHNLRDFLPAANRFGIEVLTPGRILKERLK